MLARPSQSPLTPDPDSPNNIESYVACEWIACATHFLGDGMALHQFANDYFSLFGSSKSDDELEAIIQDEWAMRWKQIPEEGGHAFPRTSGKSRHTIVPTVPFDATETAKMLKLCKARGVSISSVMFAICNIAWIRLNKGNPELPMMMYSALNMRPYLIANKSLYESYWFLAVGYFNVTLLGFLPSSNVDKTFWHRARSAKDQSSQAAKSRMVVSRSRLMSIERGQRARDWAKEDDAKANGTWQAPPASNKPKSSKPPSIATLGLSLLGNLDGMYKHSAYPDIQLHSLTTGSRQRPGGMLLFAYTFAGKLWVSFGYDENGFEEDTIQNFWDNVLSGIREFLLAPFRLDHLSLATCFRIMTVSLPYDIYVQILSHLPPTRRAHDDASVKALVTCLQTNSVLRQVASSPIIWEHIIGNVIHTCRFQSQRISMTGKPNTSRDDELTRGLYDAWTMLSVNAPTGRVSGTRRDHWISSVGMSWNWRWSTICRRNAWVSSRILCAMTSRAHSLGATGHRIYFAQLRSFMLLEFGTARSFTDFGLVHGES
ncbi:15-O-acetyltransferase Tri [Salix suchowensis]|nr:15-O-acetyltransferase Tri [Salix suchowensis]